MSSGAVLPYLFEMMIFTMGVGALSTYGQYSEFMGEFWKMRGLLNYGNQIKVGRMTHILNLTIKIIFGVASLIMFLYFLKMWMDGY